MSQAVDESHTNPMPWHEFDDIVNRLAAELVEFQKRKGITFAAVAPILRSGGVPAVMLAYKLGIVPMLSLQLKYDYKAYQTVLTNPPTLPTGFDPAKEYDILVVECVSYTGRSARIACDMLLELLPKARLHFVTIAKVFGEPAQEGYASVHIGRYTNDRLRDAPAHVRHGVTIFPWESAALELQDINDGLQQPGGGVAAGV